MNRLSRAHLLTSREPLNQEKLGLRATRNWAAQLHLVAMLKSISTSSFTVIVPPATETGFIP